MARIAYILLCHKDPEAIVAQARRLTAVGDYVAIHFDARAPADSYATIRDGLADVPSAILAPRRAACGWGEWSLVQATLYALEAAFDNFEDATHFYMLSGDCMPIKTAGHAHAFLDAAHFDYIESFDFFESDWIKTGMKEDRLIYRHYFNERGQKRLFYGALEVQRRLGLKRAIPDDLQIMIGSQWWCLRRSTIGAIMEFLRTRKDVIRFFRTTWIPDETFFQTLVRHLVPGNEIQSRSLTFLMFSDYGMPVTFYNDHHDLLLGQDFLFARKISPEATELKERLGALYVSDEASGPISGEGHRLFSYLTARGRVGQRFAARFWEAEASIGRERTLLILSCKKWHVAKRLAGSVRWHTDIPAVDYLFDEEATPLPDLGGIATTLQKRARHRRALMRMLFEQFDSDQLLICMDSGNLAVFQDFFADRCVTRLLEISCNYSADYLVGHAQRIGLLGVESDAALGAALVPTLQRQIAQESADLRDQQSEGLYRISETAPIEQTMQTLAAFLGVSDDVARRVAETPHLFED